MLFSQMEKQIQQYFNNRTAKLSKKKLIHRCAFFNFELEN
jgi:hypothetical protein